MVSARILVAALLVGCSRSETPTPPDAARAAPAAELTITFEPPDAAPLTLRADGTFSSGAEPKRLGRPSTASVFALADEAFADLGACSDAGAGPRVRVSYTREGKTATAVHARGDESCGRSLGMLERRMLGLR